MRFSLSLVDVNMKTSNRHKTVRCKICCKSMYSYNLKRHSRTHKDILSLTDSKVVEELKARHAVKLKREERRQEIERIAQKHDIPIEYCEDGNTTSLEIENMEDILLKNNQIYMEKIERGMRVAMIIDKGVVRKESLNREPSLASRSVTDITDCPRPLAD